MEEVYDHLRRKNLVPEKKKTEASAPVTLAQFQVQEHNIESIDSKTLWKVYVRGVCIYAFLLVSIFLF